MGIEDIQISEKLETNAPSIKYSGNEGPKSPQEMQQKAEYDMQEYIIEFENVFPEMKELRGTDEYMNMLEDYFRSLAKGPILPSPEDPVNPFGPKPQGPVLPNRQMAAYGGIMGMDGRRQYGFGSKLKKTIRNIIPNEVAEIAVKAAPFVAPFNPLAAGLMSGIGSFDQTGRIGSSLKSGLMNYGLGQGARYLGGADFQGGFDPRGGFTKGTTMGDGFGKYFSKPTGSGGIKELFKSKPKIAPSQMNNLSGGDSNLSSLITAPGEAPVTLEQMTNFNKIPVKNLGQPAGILKTIKDFALDNKLLTGLAAGTLGATALMGNMEPDEIQDMQRGEGLDVEGIRAEVIEAFKDPSGEKLAALRSKYPFLGTRESKDMAMGGRIGMAEGGIMDLGGMEKDYRAEGGFVPIGKAEKADDVPARLSVNEFVFTADAVRNAGGGDIDQGAQVMENMMKHLEQGGQVSEESQGMAGARDMFATSERLSEVI